MGICRVLSFWLRAAAFTRSRVETTYDLADPNGANKSIEDCVADAKAVAEAIDKPLVGLRCPASSRPSAGPSPRSR